MGQDLLKRGRKPNGQPSKNKKRVSVFLDSAVEEEAQVLEVLEKVGKKKSSLVIAAIRYYLDHNPVGESLGRVVATNNAENKLISQIDMLTGNFASSLARLTEISNIAAISPEVMARLGEQRSLEQIDSPAVSEPPVQEQETPPGHQVQKFEELNFDSDFGFDPEDLVFLENLG